MCFDFLKNTTLFEGLPRVKVWVVHGVDQEGNKILANY
jgi:hypothetical protein